MDLKWGEQGTSSCSRKADEWRHAMECSGSSMQERCETVYTVWSHSTSGASAFDQSQREGEREATAVRNDESRCTETAGRCGGTDLAEEDGLHATREPMRQTQA
jgi:hypothetical protein